VPDAAAILAKLDAIAALIAELRDEVAASLPPPVVQGNGLVDDFAPHLLIDPGAGRMRFGVAEDTLRKWARETQGTAEAIGRLRGHRWELSIPRVQKRCGLG
jgi:hypothetical protein